MTDLEKNMISDLEKVLFDFVKRVAGGKEATSETEIQILPEVAAVLRSLIIRFS